MKYISILFLIMCCHLMTRAQQRRSGIHLQVKDRTGLALKDSVVVTFNDFLTGNGIINADSSFFFSLPPATYNIMVSRKSYQSAGIRGIIVGEEKTAYVRIDLDKSPGIKIKGKKKKRRKK